MLIFLDIDGVMVPAKPWKVPEFLSDGFPAFTGKATTVLQCLIAEGGTVMLTSSHRDYYSVQEWKELFAKRGIMIDHIEKLNVPGSNLRRKDEIILWMNMNELLDDNFVILDDDSSLHDLPAFLKPKLLLTNSHIGLTEEDLKRAKQIAAIPLERV